MKVGALSDKLLAAGIAAVLTAKEAKTPKSLADYLDRHIWLVIVLIIAMALLTVLKPFQSLGARHRVARRIRLQRQILTQLGHLVEKAQAAEPTIPISDPGIHVWRPRLRPAFSVTRPLAKRLQRVGFFRLGHHPQVLEFEPLKGEGVVGLCWQDNAPKHYDITALAQVITDRTAFDGHVQAHGPASVMNLSWDQFEKVKHRGAVFATPIRDRRGKFVGCVSGDVSRGYPQLRSDVPPILDEVAAILTPEEFDLL